MDQSESLSLSPPAESEAAALVHELHHFIAGYRQIRGLDPECIYSIHRGDPMEASLRISRLKRIAELLERVPELTQQLETERMRLAVCGVVAMSDTPESAAKARDCHPDYWSASADDIARQIDELMRLRARMERHAAPVPVPVPQGGEVQP